MDLQLTAVSFKREFYGQKITVSTENSRFSSRITDTFLALGFLRGQSLTQAQHPAERAPAQALSLSLGLPITSPTGRAPARPTDTSYALGPK